MTNTLRTYLNTADAARKALATLDARHELAYARAAAHARLTALWGAL